MDQLVISLIHFPVWDSMRSDNSDEVLQTFSNFIHIGQLKGEKMEFVGPKDNQLTAFCLDKEILS